MTLEESKSFELWLNRLEAVEWLIDKVIKEKPIDINLRYLLELKGDCRLETKKIWKVRGFDKDNNRING